MADRNQARATMATFTVLIFASLTLASALAGGLDQERLAEQVEAIYDTTGTRTVPEAPRRVIWRAHRLFDELRPEIQDRLRPYLSEPGGGPNEDGSPRAPGQAQGERLLEGRHCVVYYYVSGENAVPPTDGDRSGIPDYAEITAAGVDKAYGTYTGSWGFKAPPMPKVTVHFRKLNCNAVCHPEKGGATWLELSSDIIGFNKSRLGASYSDDFTGDPDGPVAGMLRITTAHELFHSMQMMYDWNEDDWWCEGTAEWAGKAVNPGTIFYTRNLSSRFETPELSLFSNKGMNEYAASLFVQFLSDNYGGAEEGPRVIRKIWERCKDHTAEEACNLVFRDDLNADFADAFSVFSCYNYLKQYEDRQYLRDVKVTPLTNFPASARGPRLGRFGAAYFECRAGGGQGTLHVSVISGRPEFATRLITVDGQGAWRIIPLRPKSGNTVQFDIPRFGEQLTRATLVVTWHGKDETSPEYQVKAELR